MPIEPPFEVGRAFANSFQIALGKNRKPFACVRDRLGHHCRHPVGGDEQCQPQSPFLCDHFQLQASPAVSQPGVVHARTASWHVELGRPGRLLSLKGSTVAQSDDQTNHG